MPSWAVYLPAVLISQLKGGNNSVYLAQSTMVNKDSEWITHRCPNWERGSSQNPHKVGVIPFKIWALWPLLLIYQSNCRFSQRLQPDFTNLASFVSWKTSAVNGLTSIIFIPAAFTAWIHSWCSSNLLSKVHIHMKTLHSWFMMWILCTTSSKRVFSDWYPTS